MPRQSASWHGLFGLCALLPGVLAIACGAPGPPAEASIPGEHGAQEAPAQAVRPGIDVLLTDSIRLVRGRRLGLITNQTGIDRNGVSSIDRLYDEPSVELVALFAPEHGIRGDVDETVSDETDARTGLPIYSLYGANRQPTPEMLEGIEVLLFDIQDIGARYYTYIYTMARAMEAAGEASIPFVVLDRPNPIGGRLLQGNVLDPAFASAVGRYPIPMRHGMTPGELAILFRDRFGVAVDLHVVPVDGWSRDMLFPDTGLPWRPTSPNMPDLESALHYPGTCLFEGTNLSVGRGTARPFQWIGAPWLDGGELARRMAELRMPGVAFHPARFTPVGPSDGKFDGVEVGGVRLEVTDPTAYDPTVTAVALLLEARRMSGDRWEWNAERFDQLAGTQRLRTGVEQGETLEGITSDWGRQRQAFSESRAASLIYP